MTKREIAEFERTLNEYSFLEMFTSSNGERADSEKNLVKQLAINSLLLRIGYKARIDRTEEKEGIIYFHFKVEKWS